ncbi:MAG: SRPBCC family protein [Woeseiaceae bacterium]
MKTNRFIVEKTLPSKPEQLYRAWTEQFDQWFALEGTLLNWCQIGMPFYFATEFDGGRHPHYGRCLRLEKNSLLELTWVTGEPGTKGAETVVTIEFSDQKDGTGVTLSHAGFTDADSMKGHNEAWPKVLDHLQNYLDERTKD